MRHALTATLLLVAALAVGCTTDDPTPAPTPEPTLVAVAPSRDAAADYARHVVEQAVSRYESNGLDSTFDHYNRPESVDGKWYVFVIDKDDLMVGHPDGERRGLDVNGWVTGTTSARTPRGSWS